MSEEPFQIRITDKRVDLINTFCQWLIIIFSLTYFAFFLFVVSKRIFYPFEIDWTEGGMVDHAIRLLNGKPLYGAPSMEFIPYIYTPLYSYLTALFLKLFGINLWVARLVSVISSLGIGILLFRAVRKEGGSKLIALACSALFFGAFRAGGAWYDVAKTDMLFVFLTFSGTYIIANWRNSVAPVFSALILSLAFLTKQPALFFILTGLVYYSFKERKQVVVFFGGCLIIVGGSILLNNMLSDGWFNFYVFKLPLGHPIMKTKLIRFWTDDLLGNLPFPIFLLSLYFICNFAIKIIFSDIWALAFLASLAAGYSSRIHAGGYDNVLIIAFVFTISFFGILISRLLKNDKAFVEIFPGRKLRLANVIYLSIILQFGLLLYNPLKQIPSANQFKNYQIFMDKIESYDRVFIPYHGFFSTIANKQMYFHRMAYQDISRARDIDFNPEEFFRPLLENPVDAIISDREIEEVLKRKYTFKEEFFSDPSALVPLTGMQVCPRYVYELVKDK